MPALELTITLTDFQLTLLRLLTEQSLRKLTDGNGWRYLEGKWVPADRAPGHVTENLKAILKKLEKK